MTRQKSKKAQKPVKQPSIGEMFRALPPSEQEKVINFFNTQRFVKWIYSECSEETREYINYCINLDTNLKNQEDNVKPE